jgi:carboxyl-terminal processing protease
MKRFLIPGAVAIALGLTFWGGLYLGESRSFLFLGFESAPKAAPGDADLTPLYTAWNLLQKNFAASSTTAPAVTPADRVYGAIKGLADSYGDPYTTFFPPVENENFATQVRGDFGGVGMEVGEKGGTLVVVSPLKDTPASRAGVEAGDFILAIDGTDTNGMAVDEAVGKIRGPKGTSVSLTLVRGTGKPFKVAIVRDTIVLPTIDTKLRPDGVFVISLYNFDANAPQLFRDAIRAFAHSGSDKMLIDLRGNPGGYLEAAVDMASWFLPAGDTVVTQAYQDSSRDIVDRSYGYDVFSNKLKLAILMDGGSASAAEIFAGALSQNGKATLIGAKSFGKGSVQQLFPVTSNTSIKITVARWLTPNGTSISHQGIEPDIKVDTTDKDRAAGKDPQLDRAVQYLLTGK